MDMYIPLSLKLCHLAGCRLRAETRALVRDAILQSFYALRETFLEELDLEEPNHPLLISGGRAKVSGSTGSARRRQERQRARQKSTHRSAAGRTHAEGRADGQTLATTARKRTGSAGKRPRILTGQFSGRAT
jgi:hypothetical protein